VLWRCSTRNTRTASGRPGRRPWPIPLSSRLCSQSSALRKILISPSPKLTARALGPGDGRADGRRQSGVRDDLERDLVRHRSPPAASRRPVARAGQRCSWKGRCPRSGVKLALPAQATGRVVRSRPILSRSRWVMIACPVPSLTPHPSWPARRVCERRPAGSGRGSACPGQ
jgi:hypothetical protein